MTRKPVALLLEDELLIAMDVEMALSQAGFSVVTFSKCLGAEEWLLRHSPRIAVVDVSLLDGSCKTVASTLIERKIPFLVHTVRRRHADDIDPVFNAGMWFGKPAELENLATAARKLSGNVAHQVSHPMAWRHDAPPLERLPRPLGLSIVGLRSLGGCATPP